MVLKIQNGLVIVCGPVTTGKTDLATRILGECPLRNKRLIEFPEILLDKAAGGRRIGDVGLVARLKVLQDIHQAYKDSFFAVCDGCYLNESEMNSFLYGLRAIRMYYPITLIKMSPNPELRNRYLTERANEAVTSELVQKQDEEFKEILAHNFCNHASWVRNEYLIKDPDEVEIRFL